jgi:serine/threonine protein kinase
VLKAGNYELLERLARGGMGDVWKARHRALSRPAALKLLHPKAIPGSKGDRDAAIARLLREGELTASLQSPHTVQVHDAGKSSGGAYYFAMELLEGMNAEHFVYRFGPAEPRRAVRWLQQACHSLGELHARGLVHCDMKPEHIFVCRYAREADFVKVLDFGLARPASGTPGDSRTATDGPMGTAGYMAPEQVAGSGVDARTDVFALGCAAYWLLAGKMAFDADTDEELRQQHAHGTPPALASHANGGIPPRLERVIMACLSKNPGDRPADADDLAAALDASLDVGSWTDDEARRWWDAHRGDR